MKSIFVAALILISTSFAFAAPKTKKEEAFSGTQEWSKSMKDKPCFAAASKQALQVSLNLLPFKDTFEETSLALEGGSFNDKTKIYFFDVVTRKNNRANYGEPAGGTTIMAKVLSDKTCDISATPKPMQQSKE